jgi:hypothetical protein
MGRDPFKTIIYLNGEPCSQSLLLAAQKNKRIKG